jgi:hypothetical protein
LLKAIGRQPALATCNLQPATCYCNQLLPPAACLLPLLPDCYFPKKPVVSLVFPLRECTTFTVYMNKLRPLLQYFFQGLIILAPIVITAWAVISLFNFIDGILPNLLNTLFPTLVGLDTNGEPKRYPGLGFLVVIIIVILIGYLSSSFVFGRIVHFRPPARKRPG